jgi:hypothetical protein
MHIAQCSYLIVQTIDSVKLDGWSVPDNIYVSLAIDCKALCFQKIFFPRELWHLLIYILQRPWIFFLVKYGELQRFIHYASAFVFW